MREGSVARVRELTDPITAYPTERNQTPRPHRWKADGKELLAKIHRERRAMEAKNSDSLLVWDSLRRRIGRCTGSDTEPKRRYDDCRE